jgi:hypothetical protein
MLRGPKADLTPRLPALVLIGSIVLIGVLLLLA